MVKSWSKVKRNKKSKSKNKSKNNFIIRRIPTFTDVALFTDTVSLRK